MRYLASYVQRPTSPPLLADTSSGNWEIAHRRVNLSGQHSLSAIVGGAVVPNVATLQDYVGGQLLRNEVLIRQGGSGPWYRVPVTNGLTVPLPSSVTGLAQVTVAQMDDNQATNPILGLDLGEFSSASEPSRTVYLLNDGDQTIRSLALAVRTPDGDLFSTLDNRVSVAIAGTLGQSGTGQLDTSQSGTVVFRSQALNSFAISIGPNQAAPVTVSLVNFPATGLETVALEAQILLTPNNARATVPDFLDWVQGGILHTPEYSLTLVTEDPDSTGVLLQPMAARVGDRVVVQNAAVPVDPTNGAGRYSYYLNSSGIPRLRLASVATEPGDQPLAEFDWTTSGAVSNYELLAPLQEDFRYLEPESAVQVGRWVRVNPSGGLVNGGSGAIGVAVDDQGRFSSAGYTRVETSQAVSIGDRLGPDNAGVGQISQDGTAIVLQPGQPGELVQAFLIPPGAAGASGSNLSVTRTATTIEIGNDNGDGATLPAASPTEAGLLAAADKSKLDGVGSGATANSSDAFLLSRANHTGTQSVSTLSDFQEAVEDTIGATVQGGSNVTAVYDDGAGVLTVSANVATNLGTSRNSTSVILTSSTGTGITLNPANTSSAGVMTANDRTKLDGVASGATANSSDSFLRSRANHTGSQAINTVSGLQAALDGKWGIPNGIYLNQANINNNTIANGAWTNMTQQPHTELRRSGNVTASGNWQINLSSTGLYLVLVGVVYGWPNSVAKRVILGLNTGSVRLADVQNSSNESVSRDEVRYHTTFIWSGAGSYVPSVYADFLSPPLNIRILNFGMVQIL